MPSLDGFNLAAFPLFPLKYQTQHLANTDETFFWTVKAEGGNRDCFFHRFYGEVAPNADTVDYGSGIAVEQKISLRMKKVLK